MRDGWQGEGEARGAGWGRGGGYDVLRDYQIAPAMA
jgi:hypothetical protein